MARQRRKVLGRELLDRCDDDARAVLQRFLQLPRGAVDLLDHAFGLLELRDGILKLAVQHDAIGHDDGRTEDPLVGIVMQIGHLVCCPADGVGFAGACRMLDQIVVAGAVPASVRHQPAHCVELLEAGEDQLLPHFR